MKTFQIIESDDRFRFLNDILNDSEINSSLVKNTDEIYCKKMMKTTIQQQDGNLVAVLEGRLDTAAAVVTEKELQPLYDCEGKNIVFDCSKLEFISSSGLRLFLGVLKAGKPKGSRVAITGMSSELKDVFTITGFTSLFEFK